MKMGFKAFALFLIMFTPLATLQQPAYAASGLPVLSMVNQSQPDKVFLKKARKGDTLFTIIKREGFSQNHWSQIIQAQVLPKKFVISQGLNFRVGTHKKSKAKEVKFYDAHKSQAYVIWKSGTTAGVFLAPVNFEKRYKQVEGHLKGSIIQNIVDHTDDTLLAYRFLNAFKLDAKMRNLQRGAYYSLKYEDLYDGGLRIRSGEVLEASLEIKGQLRERFFIPTEEGGAFIDLQKNQDNKLLYSPVNYLNITSLFQKRRFHPIKRRRVAHLGIDFELPLGSPVLSAEDGTIMKIGKSRGAGRYVVIEHEDGVVSYYNHLNSIEKDLEIGDEVLAGEDIGTIGCSGYCTKPHLHFAVKKKGRFIDPAQVIRTYSAIQAPVIESTRTQLLRDFSDISETTL